MKKIAFVLALVAVFLFFTNPDHEDFNDYFQKRIEKQVEKNNPGPFGKFLASFSSALAGFADNAFVRDNYYLFSVYRMGDYKVLGIGGQFFPLNKIKSEDFLQLPQDKNMKQWEKKIEEAMNKVQQNIDKTADSLLKTLDDR